MIMVVSVVSRNTPPSPLITTTIQNDSGHVKVGEITKLVINQVHRVERKVQAYYTASSGPSDRGRGHK